MSADNTADSRMIRVESRGDCAQRAAVQARLAYRYHLAGGESGVACAPFAGGIQGIVACGAEPEMGGIHTGRIVAAVTDKAIRPRAMRQEPGDMRSCAHPAVVPELSISLSNADAHPGPTEQGAGALIDFRPEAV